MKDKNNETNPAFVNRIAFFEKKKNKTKLTRRYLNRCSGPGSPHTWRLVMGSCICLMRTVTLAQCHRPGSLHHSTDI